MLTGAVQKIKFFISRISENSNKYLFGKNINNEGFFIWYGMIIPLWI